MDSSSGCAPRAGAPSSRTADGKAVSASPPDRGFPRRCRLTSRRQFQEVYRRGVRVRRSSLTLFGLTNDVGLLRIGITATRKSGSAVVRNRIKRVLREIFRQHRYRYEGVGVDVVVNARPGADFSAYGTIEREFLDALGHLVRRCRG